MRRDEFNRRMADALSGGRHGWEVAERERQESLALEIMRDRGLYPRPPKREEVYNDCDDTYAGWAQ